MGANSGSGVQLMQGISGISIPPNNISSSLSLGVMPIPYAAGMHQSYSSDSAGLYQSHNFMQHAMIEHPPIGEADADEFEQFDNDEMGSYDGSQF